jgi:hypothetical protein
MEAINRWHVPVNVKEFRGFLGLADYYRWFIRNYGVISHLLSNLLKKGVLSVWSSTTQHAFEAIK